MIALVLLVPASAALTLDEARSIAVERALAVERARAQADVADGLADIALGAAFPSIVAQASVGRSRNQTFIGEVGQESLSAQLVGSWRIVDPGTWAASSAARHTARGAEALAIWAMVDARAQATERYARVLAADASVEALADAVAIAGEGTDAVRGLVEAGLRPGADLAQARAQEASVRASYEEARGTAAAACASLQGLLRVDASVGCDLAPVDDWAAAEPAGGPHPAVVAAEEAVRAARGDVAAATAGLAPVVEATGTAGFTDVTVVRSGEESTFAGPAWSAALTATMPLFTGLQVWSGRAVAMASRRAAEATLEEEERALEVATVSAEAGLRAATAAMDARRQGLRAAQEAFELVDERYKSGLAPITEWLTVRQALWDAQVSLAAAAGNLGAAVAEVERNRGVR